MFFVVLDSFATNCIGWPTSRFSCLSSSCAHLFLIDNAKVQHFLPYSKFCPSIWADFDEEFIEIAHARQSSSKLGFALA